MYVYIYVSAQARSGRNVDTVRGNPSARSMVFVNSPKKDATYFEAY